MPSRQIYDKPDTSGLTIFEKLVFGLARIVNQHFKILSALWQWYVLDFIFHVFIGRLVRIRGLEHVQALPKGQSYMLVANHRTFFDFFMVSKAAHHWGRVVRRVYFPVRANFFYQSFGGLLVNTLIAGFGMYPPIFRERKKLAFNRWSMNESIRLLKMPSSMVGIHPEGTRNKGPDPYALLPAQPGAGRVAIGAQVPIVPAFVLGMSNNLWGLLKRNYSRNGAPIYIVFGPPIELADLYAEGDRAPTHKLIADRLRDAISALGQEERRWEEAETADRVASQAAAR